MQISTKTLVAVAKATSLFMAKNDVRIYLNGAHLIGNTNELIVETSDGTRVAQVRLDVVTGGSEFDVIIDRDTWLAVSKIKTARKDKSVITLSVADGRLTMSNGMVFPLEFVDRKFRKFPDVNRFLRAAPSVAEQQTTVGVNAVLASEAFKAAAILANPKYKGTKLTVTTCHDVLTIETPTDHGEFEGLHKPAVFAVMPMRL